MNGYSTTTSDQKQELVSSAGIIFLEIRINILDHKVRFVELVFDVILVTGGTVCYPARVPCVRLPFLYVREASVRLAS